MHASGGYGSLLLMKLPKDLSCIDKLVLLYVTLTGPGEYSVSRLSEALGISRKSSHISLRRLILKGYFNIIEEAKGSRGGYYQLDKEIRKELDVPASID